MNFFDIAKPMAERYEPQIRTRPQSKIAMDANWQDLATTDLNVLARWSEETPAAGAASVAKAEIGGVWFWEIDSPEAKQRMETETGKKLLGGFRVRSSPGKGHFHFLQNSSSIKMGNISQGSVKGGDWSARVNNQYVVSPGSLHPRTNLPYEIVSDGPLTEAPDWLIDWLISQKIESKINTLDDSSSDLIIEGGRNVRLTSIAGKLRQAGLDRDALETALLDINQKRCNPPLSTEEVCVIVNSISKYPVGKEDLVLVGGRPAGSIISQASRVVLAESEDAIQITPVPYPKFPDWVMQDTSIYTGLVRPFCDVNSRYPEMMFMPAMTVLLNYVGNKVRIERKNLIPSIFLVLIGRRGKVIKSSSVEDAIRYFEYAGIVGHNEHNQNNANGRALVFTPASPEGLGIEMQRTNCRNAIMFFDELKTLVNKASIESSTLSSTLLTAYESGKLQNLTKNLKNSYSFLPGSYVASLIACSTDKNFTLNWGKLAGNSTGLDDRFVFVLQPEVLKPLTPYIHVDTQDGAAKTRQLIEKAIQKGVYSIVDSSPLSRFTAENEDANRAEIRAEKFALGLAIDMGLEELDEEVIERALAIVAYEQAVKKYLRTYEATTREGSLQMEVMYNLRKAGGRMLQRDLYRILHPERHGSSLWASVYNGLIKSGWIREEGTGVKGNPIMVILLKVPEEDDD